jgi:hypothetical protein
MADINLDNYEEVPSTKVGAGEYIGQQAIQGSTSALGSAVGTGAGMGFAGAAGGFAPLLQYFTGDKAFQQPEITPQAVQEATAKVRSALGVKEEMKAPGYISGAVGAGVKAATDPYSYLIPNAGPLKSIITNFLYGVYAEEGANIGEKVTGGEGGRAVGALAATVLNPSVFMESALNNIASSKLITPQKMQQLAATFGDQKAAAMIASAYAADPALKAKLLRAAELAESTGVSIPLLQAADNNVLTQTARSLGARDLSFQASYAQLEQDAAAQLLKRQGGLFGSIAESKMFNALGAPTKVAPKVEQRIKSVDEQMSDLAGSFERSEYQNIGEKLRNLVQVKENRVRTEVGKKYTSVIDAAESQGYKVSSEETGNLVSFVNQAENADIFKQFPSLNGLIKKNFRPQTTEAGALVDPSTGMPYVAAGQEFPTASMKDLDSLKREINKTIRNLPEAKSDLMPYLSDLKSQVGKVIDNMPGDLGTAYKAVDKEYMARVGIPYGAKTVQDIKYKDFVESSIPALTKNKTALSDYLASVDRNDALGVVKDAFFADATRYGVVKDGVLNPKRLDAYLASNKDALTLVPEIRDALKNASKDGFEFQQTLGKLDDMKAVQDTQASAQIFNKLNKSGLEGVASEFMTSPQFRNTFMSAGGAGRNDAAIKTLRAKMTDMAFSSSNPIEYIASNKDAYDRAFGKTYTNSLVDLAEVSTKLKDKFFINTPLKTIQRTGFEEATGTSPASALSVIRDRIAGPVHQAAILLSKFYVNQVDQGTKQSLAKFLSDPQAVLKINQALKRAEAFDTKGISEKTVKFMEDTLSGVLPIMVRRGIVGVGIATSPSQQGPQQTQQPLNLENYEEVQQ